LGNPEIAQQYSEHDADSLIEVGCWNNDSKKIVDEAIEVGLKSICLKLRMKFGRKLVREAVLFWLSQLQCWRDQSCISIIYHGFDSCLDAGEWSRSSCLWNHARKWAHSVTWDTSIWFTSLTCCHCDSWKHGWIIHLNFWDSQIVNQHQLWLVRLGFLLWLGSTSVHRTKGLVFTFWNIMHELCSGFLLLSSKTLPRKKGLQLMRIGYMFSDVIELNA
jgi:hypothetical protein